MRVMDMEIIGVVSKGKNSGKTTTVEDIVRELVKRGYRCGTVKHICKEGGFTLDKENTDTWRHARAGARVVVGVSREETAYIMKTEKEPRLSDVIRGIGDIGRELDYLIVEGFSKEKIPKIAVGLSGDDLEEVVDENTILISGPAANPDVSLSLNLKYDVPAIDATKNPAGVVDVIEGLEKRFDAVFERLPKLNCGKCGFETCEETANNIIIGNAKLEDCVVLATEKEVLLKIGDMEVPLGSFVQDFVKNGFLGMIKTLKKADVKGGDVVELKIRVGEDDVR
jgi:molybdopterin-guanine dinucleotide biosynthesis adapter protein